MNLILWTLQSLAALLYSTSGFMKLFMFDRISKDVVSFGAIPKKAWMALGLVELACVVGLILPAFVRLSPVVPPIAAGTLAAESLIFILIHTKYREYGTITFCLVLGLAMAFLAFGRVSLSPLTQ